MKRYRSVPYSDTHTHPHPLSPPPPTHKHGVRSKLLRLLQLLLQLHLLQLQPLQRHPLHLDSGLQCLPPTHLHHPLHVLLKLQLVERNPSIVQPRAHVTQLIGPKKTDCP